MKGNLAKWVVNNNDEEFERMMNSEVPLPFIDKRTNRETIKWQQKPGVPNHYWDCELMSLVMATMCGVYGDVTQKVDNKE